MITSFKWIGAAEGLSLLALLFVAMPLKYLAGEPEWVRVVGTAHGALFLLYVCNAFVLMTELGWTKGKLLLSIFLASVPFGTFLFERKFAELPGAKVSG